LPNHSLAEGVAGVQRLPGKNTALLDMEYKNNTFVKSQLRRGSCQSSKTPWKKYRIVRYGMSKVYIFQITASQRELLEFRDSLKKNSNIQYLHMYSIMEHC
jgi:hypothetical protein